LNVSKRNVDILLSDEGFEALQLAIPELPESRVTSLHVHDADEMGVWADVPRPDGEHALLIRWEFIVTVDVKLKQNKTLGLKA